MVTKTKNRRRYNLKFHLYSQTEASKHIGPARERAWTKLPTSHKGRTPNGVERIPSLGKLEWVTSKDTKRGLQIQTFPGSRQPRAMGGWCPLGTGPLRSLEQNGFQQLQGAQGRAYPSQGQPATGTKPDFRSFTRTVLVSPCVLLSSSFLVLFFF